MSLYRMDQKGGKDGGGGKKEQELHAEKALGQGSYPDAGERSLMKCIGW